MSTKGPYNSSNTSTEKSAYRKASLYLPQSSYIQATYTATLAVSIALFPQYDSYIKNESLK